MHNRKKSIPEEFTDIKEYFSPRVIGEVNEAYVKLAKIKGDAIPWHSHTDEDELFYIVRGTMTMEVRGQTATRLVEGDMFIVKRATEHRVTSVEECWIMLVENKETKHTGDITTSITKSIEDQRY